MTLDRDAPVACALHRRAEAGSSHFRASAAPSSLFEGIVTCRDQVSRRQVSTVCDPL